MLDTASSKVNGIMYVGDVRVANRNLLKYSNAAKRKPNVMVTAASVAITI